MPFAGEDVFDQDEEKQGISALIGRLVEDGKAYARAEARYVKTLAGERLREAKTGVIFFVAGLVLLHGALIALFVGAVLSLAMLVGPFWSMVIVVLVASIAGGILAKIGLSHFQRVKDGPELPNVEAVEP